MVNLIKLAGMFRKDGKVSSRTKKALVGYSNTYTLRCHKCGRRETLMKVTKDLYICTSCQPLPKTSRHERRA